MVFESNKPIKICPFCKTEIRNLGLHIVNKHKEQLDRLDNLSNPSINSNDKENLSLRNTNPETAPHNAVYRGSINDLIKEKLDTMLNLKIIEMLSKNPNISINELSSAINPQPVAQEKDIIEKLKEYKEIQNLISNNNNIETNDPDIMSVITQAFPLLTEFLKNKNGVEKNDTEFRTTETRGIATIKPISLETSEYRAKSDNFSTKSGNISTTEQQDNSIDAKSFAELKRNGI